MICASRVVPSVTTTSACVSPRVNSAEPWVRGSTPTRAVIARTSSSWRPSMRTLVFSTLSRMVWYSSSPNSLASSPDAQPWASAWGFSSAITSALIAEIASRRCSLSRTWNACASLSPTAPLMAATSDSLRAGGCQSHDGLAASAASSAMARIATCICW